MAAVDDPISDAPWWRRKLMWGVLVSVLLGGVSMIIEGVEFDFKVAALITLLGVALTIIVDLRLQFEEATLVNHARNKDLQANLDDFREAHTSFDRHIDRFADYVAAPDSCRDFLAEISDDWRRIDDRSSVFLGWLRQDAEREFTVRLHELAAGHGAVDRRIRQHFRSHPLVDFERIRSIDAGLTNYWNTAGGRRYLSSQRSGIAANSLDVSRIFVIRRAELANARDIIREHVQAGVTVSIVIREEIDYDPEVPDIEDMSLVTDLSGFVGVLKPQSPGEPELFTGEERQVGRAEELIEFLGQYARDVDDIYAS